MKIDILQTCSFILSSKGKSLWNRCAHINKYRKIWLFYLVYKKTYNEHSAICYSRIYFNCKSQVLYIWRIQCFSFNLVTCCSWRLLIIYLIHFVKCLSFFVCCQQVRSCTRGSYHSRALRITSSKYLLLWVRKQTNSAISSSWTKVTKCVF